MIEMIQGLASPLGTLNIDNQRTTNIKGDDFVFTKALDAAKGLLEATQEAEDITTELTNDFISGKNQNIHELMIAQEKSSILLQFTMQVRNQTITAYNEIMRMQV